MKYLVTYLGSLVAFLMVDFLWLGYLAKNIYAKYLGELIADQVNWVAAIGFYMLFVVGVLVFAVVPSVEKDSVLWAVGSGALFGLMTYATYDLTNLATLKGWPWQIVGIDIVWGMFVTGVTAVVGYYLK